MNINDFLGTLSAQSIVERDYVTVSFLNGATQATLSGTIIPHDNVVHLDGEMNSRIIHPRDGGVIVIKTTPDGLGPDIGKPIKVESIISISKNS